MAKIGNKDINDLSNWNIKELRKLRISINNRIQALESNPKKEAGPKSLLKGMEKGDLKELLLAVKRAEKSLCY